MDTPVVVLLVLLAGAALVCLGLWWKLWTTTRYLEKLRREFVLAEVDAAAAHREAVAKQAELDALRETRRAIEAANKRANDAAPTTDSHIADAITGLTRR